jgi:soluble lytic murein transglycosylase
VKLKHVLIGVGTAVGGYFLYKKFWPKTQAPAQVQAQTTRSANIEVLHTADVMAEKYKLLPSLVNAIIEVESGGDANAVSSAGAHGLMQVMPKTWDWVCSSVIKPAVNWNFDTDAFTPEKNIEVGCAYLAWLYNYWTNRKDSIQCSIDVAVIASYNAGQGTVLNQRGVIEALPNETRNYIVKVQEAL